MTSPEHSWRRPDTSPFSTEQTSTTTGLGQKMNIPSPSPSARDRVDIGSLSLSATNPFLAGAAREVSMSALGGRGTHVGGSPSQPTTPQTMHAQVEPWYHNSSHPNLPSTFMSTTSSDSGSSSPPKASPVFDPFDDTHASEASISPKVKRLTPMSNGGIGAVPASAARINEMAKGLEVQLGRDLTEKSFNFGVRRSTVADIQTIQNPSSISKLLTSEARSISATTSNLPGGSSALAAENCTGGGVKDLARAFDGLSATAVTGSKPVQSSGFQTSGKAFPGWVTFEESGSASNSTPIAPAAANTAAKQVTEMPPSVKPVSVGTRPLPINTVNLSPGFDDLRRTAGSQPLGFSSSAGALLPPPPGSKMSPRRTRNGEMSNASPLELYDEPSSNASIHPSRLVSSPSILTSQDLRDDARPTFANPFGDEFDIAKSIPSSEDEHSGDEDDRDENEKARLANLKKAKKAKARMSGGKHGSVAALAQSFGSSNALDSVNPPALGRTGKPSIQTTPDQPLPPSMSDRHNIHANPFSEIITPPSPLVRMESPHPRVTQTDAMRPVLSTSPQKPPLPPRPVSPMDRQATVRRAVSPNAATVFNSAPPLPARPVARAVEEALEAYVASASPANMEALSVTDDRFAALRGREKLYSPDTVHTNRRPPVAEGLPNSDLYLKSPARCFALSGYYACTGSEKIRVWYIPSGENMRTVSIGESKMYAMAFAPTYYMEDEGRYLWVALEKGEIIEVDISVGEIVDRRSLHSATVTHMLRYHGQLWTLDENGGLKIWSIDPERHRTTLQQRPRVIRVSSKQTVAFAANGRLWTAAGKMIEVYHPTEEASSCFQQRFDGTLTAGHVTCFAATRDGTTVFSGHDDGKITVWDAVTLVKKRIVNAGMYRVTSLLGIGEQYLWAGFSTGKIYVYDVKHMDGGWTAVKEFPAYHSASVDELVMDERSIFLSGRLQIASMSDNGQIRMWDGFLTRDWIENQLRSREHECCTYRDLKVLICSWNLDASKPAELEESRVPEEYNFLNRWLTVADQPEIIVIGFQELVDLESKKVTAKQLLKGTKKSQQSHMDHRFKMWQEALVRAVDMAQSKARYRVVECRQLVGLFQCVFIKETEMVRIKDIAVNMVKTGLKGYHGNKGGIATRFVLDDSSFCFVNCHLAAHQNQVSARNNDTATILKDAHFPPKPSYEGVFVGGGDGSLILDHENVFWSGDLNYRIDLARERVVELVEQQDWATLQEHDQLIRQMMTNPSFGLRGFAEGPLNFAPTFKYDVGMDRYDTSEKRRVPSWCDRVLYRGPDVRLQVYTRFSPSISDHRPIAASFIVRVKSANNDLFVPVKGDVDAKLQFYLSRAIEIEKIQWLCDVCGCSREVARTCLGDVGGELRLARDRIGAMGLGPGS
ncbi:hypothetical protein SpCBS45565_g01896 [Spizellomyces sp. 'palustris']|nr:hypothetical protein SpCBS45565_g01896 [Spizellomyces sp. 'palustris']